MRFKMLADFIISVLDKYQVKKLAVTLLNYSEKKVLVVVSAEKSTTSLQ